MSIIIVTPIVVKILLNQKWFRQMNVLEYMFNIISMFNISIFNMFNIYIFSNQFYIGFITIFINILQLDLFRFFEKKCENWL